MEREERRAGGSREEVQRGRHLSRGEVCVQNKCVRELIRKGEEEGEKWGKAELDFRT